jgi:hypothetical protein
MTSEVKTPDLPRDTIPHGAQDAPAATAHQPAWPEFENPDPNRDETDQAAGNAVVDPPIMAWTSETQP